jgi:hypothetical protein
MHKITIIMTNMTVARQFFGKQILEVTHPTVGPPFAWQRFGKHRLKGGIMEQ